MGEAKRRNKNSTPRAARPVNHKPGQGKPWLIVAVVAVIIAVIGGIFYVTRMPDPGSDVLPTVDANTPPFPAELDQYGVSIGSDSAPVVVREFADYQCPACGRFSEASKHLRANYVTSGEVRLVYFDFPLPQHKNAMPAAEAAHCARDQGKFWSMQDRLFSTQTDWSESDKPLEMFARYATDLQLDERRFRQCMTTELHREEISQGRVVAAKLALSSTPTVLVNNIQLTRPGWPQLAGVVARELAAAKEPLNSQ